ncbi:transcription factor Tfb2 [Dacryopinax primogenitus]|uniref:RNA polymerase II transcription factor B subunit 2 n=1 Tax=Dacryopinax primogenitus (strain DJM 731) TaxID=1858805 RepID=M5GDH8_DACPD|nr:transcription factor Tfb2 [Dacryopinax primogenitus]EJU04542.1 transcription factor Tfb2 [Dacryopinax primogenitus]
MSDQQHTAQLSPIHAFLTTRPQTALSRLYTRPSACLAVFRLLDDVARQIVMSLLWLDSKTGVDLTAWVVPNEDSRKHYAAALQDLVRLHIAKEANGRILLLPAFQSGLRRALTGGGEHRSFGVPCPGARGKEVMATEQLDDYASERWESILHFMVSSGSSAGRVPPPSIAVIFLLRRSGLMVPIGAERHPESRITSKGFQFLLEDSHTQLWELLLQYLAMSEDQGRDLVEVIGFLFMLGSMQLGQEYSTENLSETQDVMLQDFLDYGLIYRRNPDDHTRFYPTRLATTLTSTSSLAFTSSKHEKAASSEGFIILETNYRVYAYTENPLQIAVLNLFVALHSRFENLVIGRLTRESIKAALANGITADQIISYLTVHAHPMMHKNNPVLPVTVQDQIRLWQLEKNRLKSENGYLYEDFNSQGDFDLVLNYAKQLDVVLWENREKRKMFVREDGHENVREFIRRRAES